MYKTKLVIKEDKISKLTQDYEILDDQNTIMKEEIEKMNEYIKELSQVLKDLQNEDSEEVVDLRSKLKTFEAKILILEHEKQKLKLLTQDLEGKLLKCQADLEYNQDQWSSKISGGSPSYL